MKKINYYEISIQKMEFLNYSKNTIKTYDYYLHEFLNKIDVYPTRLTSTDFQNYIDNYTFTSISQQNQVISAIKFLYEKVLNKKYNKVSFTRPRKEKKLPRVIDNELIKLKLSKIDNLKHKTILSLVYSVGLRVSEVVNLKIEDIDSKRMIIHIKNAKGKKDRIVPLSPNILDLLRTYWTVYRTKTYLFEGQLQNTQYSIGSCQKIYKKYISDKSSIHTLRHSCFTSLVENGTNLRIIQSIAGHQSSKTTEIYTHVSKTILNKVNLPL